MEKNPNSNAPTLKLVNGPAGREKRKLKPMLDSIRAVRVHRLSGKTGGVITKKEQKKVFSHRNPPLF